MKYSPSVPPSASGRPELARGEQAVERAIEAAGLVADHVHHRQQVLVVDRLIALGGRHARELERHELALRVSHAELQEFGELAVPLGRQRDAHGHLVLRHAVVQRRDVHAGEAHAHGVDDVAARHRDERGLRLVDLELQARRGIFDAVVDADDVGRGGERRAHLARDAAAAGFVGAVDLGHYRREHRRPGRNLDHLHARVPAAGDLLQARPHRLRDLVALAVALLLAFQVHLQIARLRSGAKYWRTRPLKLIGAAMPA